MEGGQIKVESGLCRCRWSIGEIKTHPTEVREIREPKILNRSKS